MGNQKIKLNTLALLLMIFLIFGFSLASFIYSLSASFPEIKNAVKPLAQVQAQTTSLYLVNIHERSITSSSVIIAWETNLEADSTVRIGTNTNYNDFTCDTCTSATFEKIHQIPISGLNPSTTYHYQVISKTASGETKTSLDRSFTTPSFSQDTEAPYVTYIGIDTYGTHADMRIYTSKDANVTVYYSSSSGVTTATFDSSAADAPGSYTSTHVLTLSPLVASTPTNPSVYYYRIQSVDSADNTTISGEFHFTAAQAGDHYFDTGDCNGVPLGACSSDGLYCDVGTGTLRNYCGMCGYTCPAGQTCQDDGACTDDPGLTGDPYQCNPDRCYQDGLFIIPAEAGCYSTYPRCTANTILKVRKDRECAKWLTCGTGIETTDSTTGEKEELCLDLAVCTSLGEGGQCNSYVNLPQEEQTFRTPDEIDQIKWLTGSINAGLDWQYEAGAPMIKGYYPWSAMTEIGQKLTIDNWNFEETALKTIKKEGNNINIPSYDINLWSNFRKFPNEDYNTTAINIIQDTRIQYQKENHVLKVENINDLNRGVSVKVNGLTNISSDYVLSFKAKSDSPESQITAVALNNSPSLLGAVNFGAYNLNTSWREITTDPIKGPGGAETYLLIYLSSGSTQPFYLDDIRLEPVLEARSGVYLKRSCRLYPKEDSPSCEYYDDNGIYNKGWYGYCLQRDPQNESKCISWWPVDILYGESNLFGQEESAGYTGRTPLYYCLESYGYNGTEYIINYYNVDGTSIGTESTSIDDYKLNFDGNYLLWAGTEWSLTLDSPRLQLLNAGLPVTDARTIQPDDIAFIKLESDFNPNLWGGVITKDMFESGFECDQNSTPFKCNNPGELGSKTEDGNIVWYLDKEGGTTFEIHFEPSPMYDLRKIVERNDGDTTMTITYTFYLKEPCKKLIKLADTGGENMAWADNINSKGYTIDDLNYVIDTDFNPFGGAVVSSTDPSLWASKVYSEEPNTNFDSPYQERSGKPYACFGECSVRYCWGGGDKEGKLCQTNNDCYDSVNLAQGICIGGGTCASGAEACTMDYQETCPSGEICCGKIGDYCIGGTASNKSDQWVNNYPQNDDRYYATLRLRGLFAQSYGLWSWDGDSYEQQSAEYKWFPPTLKCQSRIDYNWTECVGIDDGANCEEVCASRGLQADDLCVDSQGNANMCTEGYDDEVICATSSNFATSVTTSCTQAFSYFSPLTERWKCCCGNMLTERPAYDPNNSDTYCGIAPKITNLKLNDGNSNVVYLGPDGGKVILSFNSIVDRQQQPLKVFYIDWGDGVDENGDGQIVGDERNIQTINFGYRSKSDSDNPHIYTHSYGSCPDNVCEIKIVAEDNWDWCSASPDMGLGNVYTCHGGSMDGMICETDYDCRLVDSCLRDDSYTCDRIDKDYWDPVSVCRDGGSCVDGICAGGTDDGRSCTPLKVDLSG